jgi:hypothetical protein
MRQTKRVTTINTKMPRGLLPTFRDAKFATFPVATEFAQVEYLRHKDKTKRVGAVNSAMKRLSTATSQFLDFFLKQPDVKSEADIWDAVDEDSLGRFRDECLKQTLADSRGKDEDSAKRTTNLKLMRMYDLLAWGQVEGKIPPKTIGMRGCSVKSSAAYLLEHPERAHLATVKKLYPLLYADAGEHSRMAAPQHTPTPLEVEAIEDVFRAQPNVHAGRRNGILTTLGHHRGWRAGSVLSLTTDQFSDELIEKGQKSGHKEFQVTPPTQKLGYSVSYGLPWALAYRIQAYIRTSTEQEKKGGRQLLMEEYGVTEKEACNMIFLACGGRGRSTALLPQSLSEIFSAAFRLAGVSQRCGYHSLRRDFADGQMRAQIEYRMRHGLSTALEEVVPLMSAQLGHSSKTAYRSYVRVMAHLWNHSVEEELRTQVIALEAEVEQSKSSADTLRQALDDERAARLQAEAELAALKMKLASGNGSSSGPRIGRPAQVFSVSARFKRVS